MIKYGIELGEWKTAELAADEMIAEATDAKEVATAHFQSGALFISEGSIAKMFGVTAIPHAFTIDADGVLQEEHIGDASIEGKLKKLLVHTRELRPAKTSSAK